MWFDAQEDVVRCVQVLPPYDWLFIGTNPFDGMTREFAESFDLFMNVSDCPHEVLLPEKPRPDTRMLWYPVAELSDWTYGPFYWSKRVLDEALEKKTQTYLHCDSGVNRSPCIAMAWLTSKKHSLEEAALLISRERESYADTRVSRFQRNIEQGYIPKQLPEFYARCEEYLVEGFQLDYDNILYKDPPIVALPERLAKFRGKK
ncbi:dual specificity protein phosphatase family protein [Candidatus Woesearchaeota archaeon]|nr:dual specificity protein phosphatase family protein [Candidatus Woesearchaeota archaeon]